MNTINDILSRLRIKAKALNKDGFVTDRQLYSSLLKFTPALLKREDSKNLLYTLHGIFQTLPYVELIEVDKIETKCFKITTDCTIRRTKNRLPKTFYGYKFVLLKSITGISGPATDADDEDEFELIDALEYASIVKSKTFKYNKTKYCWFADGYLWFPNIEWDAVRLEGLFEDDIEKYKCGECVTCRPRQEQFFAVPAYLFPELEGFVFEDLGISMKIPSDTVEDKQNLNRTT